MKLYYCAQTRAIRPRWILEELGVPYELAHIDVMKGEHKQPAYMKIHPLGVVPALDDGGSIFFESAAIVQYLADKYADKGLAPALGTKERGEYYQWISCAMTELEPSLTTIILNTLILPEAQRDPAAIKKASERYKVVCPIFDERLKGREYIVGDRFSAADIVVGAVLALGTRLGQGLEYPHVQAYLKRVTSRPAAQRAFA
ncbi:glutathione S-transferase family protein [Stigmatella aurantiaca]|uniref:Glutathione S-transferase n=1 Tax=Stigmatella aurantiaca (strain DW4/3-1) TaxID=378806 RepID=Q08XY9_STIAD|nr:glutathione S-transferase family protein [Stigmatella aurantiaca]ADO75532.1 Glutathione S-transferase [Stigmatella aurantiaca DW4/3-1]EAU65355.1 putative glutathione S-transferase protein [Stigmatella aurantiaca DW4/3-1]